MHWLLLAAAALPLLAASARAEPTTLSLDELLRHMASTRGVVAEFREVKTLALLDEPLEARGTLYFQPPDRFVRVTHEPAATRLVLVGSRMRFEDATGASDVDLAENPVARQFADNLVALWRGDRARLEKLYRLDFRADASRWELALAPRGAPLDRFIASIRLSGDGATMREMELLEQDGDRTLTHFEKSDVDHAFGAEEQRAVFGSP
jgi:outer membrane lipoprotein-sorting protein